MDRARRRQAATILFMGLAGLLACTSAETPEPLQVYDLHGKIIRVQAADGLLIVEHDEIEGWMDAMTMEFPVAEAADLERLSEGDRIDAKVEVRGLDYHLADIRVLPPEPAPDEELLPE